MATLPIMQSGMPEMDMGMMQQGAIPQGVPPQQPPLSFMQQDTQPTDPQSDSVDTLLSTLTPVLDVRSSESLLDDIERGLSTNAYNPKSLTDKAVKRSFTLGIKDISDLFSKGQYSNEYFGKSGINSLSSAADAYAALSQFMKATNPKKQSESLSSFRDSVSQLTTISQRLLNITDRHKQSHFLQDMQSSNDQIVNQIIGDATSNTDNGSAAFEYIITGNIPQGTPLAMIQNQATQLWQAIAKTVADSMNSQIISLFQQSLAGMLRSDALSNSMTPDGMVDQPTLGQNIMDNMQMTQQKVSQIQQVVDALFTPKLEAKMQQPQQHPISSASLKHFTAA